MENKKLIPNWKHILIFFGIVLFFVILFLVTINVIKYIEKEKLDNHVFNYTLEKNEFGLDIPKFDIDNIDNTVASITNSSDIKLLNFYVIDNNYINLFINTNDTYKSYLIDLRTGSELSYDNIFNINDLFNDYQYKQLLNKYPKFIADAAKLDGASYDVYNNHMIIYYKYEIAEPVINEVASIDANYNEIKDYLKYNYTLDETYTNNNVYVLDPNKKTVALTFDDGPAGSKTKRVIGFLKDNHANATFFEVGNRMNANKETILEVLNNGNEIGSHTYDHAYLTKISAAAIQNEIETTNNIFKSITGKDLTLLRPPYGAYNSSLVSSINYAFVLWSLDTLDWKNRDVETNYNNVINSIKDGDIILFHDIHEESVLTIEKLLPALYSMGYQVTTVSKLAELKGYTIEPNHVYNHFR